MTTNVGTMDRVLRALAGLILLSLTFWGPQSPWGLIGLVPLVTALAGFCPAYRLLGICTAKRAEAK